MRLDAIFSALNLWRGALRPEISLAAKIAGRVRRVEPRGRGRVLTNRQPNADLDVPPSNRCAKACLKLKDIGAASWLRHHPRFPRGDDGQEIDAAEEALLA